MSSVPDFATHYYLSSRRPLQNLSDLGDDDAIAVMSQLEALRLEGGQHRRFGLPYLAMRPGDRATPQESLHRGWGAT